jgi:hypothetical protein
VEPEIMNTSQAVNRAMKSGDKRKGRRVLTCARAELKVMGTKFIPGHPRHNSVTAAEKLSKSDAPIVDDFPDGTDVEEMRVEAYIKGA